MSIVIAALAALALFASQPTLPPASTTTAAAAPAPGAGGVGVDDVIPPLGL